MKKSLILILATTFSFSVFAAGEVQTACVKNEKTGKEVCKKIKVHKKLEVEKPSAPTKK